MKISPSQSGYRLSLHLAAMAVATATFPLIFLGGLVTSHQAGMSVPDWPNSWGYNMFLLPPSYWLGRQAGGVFYEHTHRLLGMLAGFASIVLVCLAYGPGRGERARRGLGWSVVAAVVLAGLSGVAWLALHGSRHLAARMMPHLVVGWAAVGLVLLTAWLCRVPEERASVRRLAAGILVAVVIQGVLGGLRVVLINLDLAVVHGCFAQAFFCMTGMMVAMTSRWWPGSARHEGLKARRHGGELEPSGEESLRRVFWVAVVAAVVIYGQLVVGAMMRHYQAGLAIPDMPLAYGKLLPPTDAAGLAQINRQRILLDDPRIGRVTLGQVWLHFGHRLGAIAVSTMLLTLVWTVLRQARGTALLARPAWLLLVLLATQLTLGWLTVTNRKPADIASYHVAIGAMVLLVTFTLAVRAKRLTAHPRPAISAERRSMPAGEPAMAWESCGNNSAEGPRPGPLPVGEDEQPNVELFPHG
ncbi:MAG: COX15/CtaA family protein [Tepidisphaeraceae bacterium]|jgi:cytochrome c oxidase assembly protein subunit 15